MHPQTSIISGTKHRKISGPVSRVAFLKLFSIQKGTKAFDKQRKKGQVQSVLDYAYTFKFYHMLFVQNIINTIEY